MQAEAYYKIRSEHEQMLSEAAVTVLSKGRITPRAGQSHAELLIMKGALYVLTHTSYGRMDEVEASLLAAAISSEHRAICYRQQERENYSETYIKVGAAAAIAATLKGAV